MSEQHGVAPAGEAASESFSEPVEQGVGDSFRAHGMAEDLGESVPRRSKTMSRKEMARDLRRRQNAEFDPDEQLLLAELDGMRPRTRADCANSVRPCFFVSCKHHLYLDVNPDTGSVKVNFPDKELWELENTCALDVADKGGITLEEVGAIMNLTRERIRQVETSGLSKLREAAGDDFKD